jgi:putative peptide zinc metalloprotease protein
VNGSPWRLAWAISGAILFVAALGCEAAPPASDDSPSPVVAGESATPTPTPFDASVILEEFPDSAPRNVVMAENSEDQRFMGRASIKFRKLKSDEIRPINIAFAQGACTDCQTIAVAVQVIVYKRGASNVQPQNVALAANTQCTRCVTIARAIQYVVPVDDFDDVPDNVKRLVHRLDQELRYFERMRSIDELTSEEAAVRLQRAVDEFNELHQYMVDVMTKRTGENEEDPGAKETGDRLRESPSPSPSPTSSAPADSTTPSPTATPGSPTPAATATP